MEKHYENIIKHYEKIIKAKDEIIQILSCKQTPKVHIQAPKVYTYNPDAGIDPEELLK